MDREVLLGMFNNRVQNTDERYSNIAIDIAENEEEEDFLLNLAYVMKGEY